MLAAVAALAIFAIIGAIGSTASAGGSVRAALPVTSPPNSIGNPGGATPHMDVSPPPPPPPSQLFNGHKRAGRGGGGNPALARLHATASAARAAHDINASSVSQYSRAHIGVSNRSDPSAAEVRQWRRRYHGRKFLFPLLDQGPNNQFLQFRVALAKARQLNRTLVLPIWLPHNPRFLHLHPGAPATPSRDKKLDQVWYPFDAAFEPEAVSRYVRTIPLDTFRALLPDAKLDRCIAPHATGFESYLRLSRLGCAAFDTGGAASSAHRFVGFHLYDYDVGTRDKYYGYMRTASSLVDHATGLASQLFGGAGARGGMSHGGGGAYLAAHVRVADAHWEKSDCKHTINGLPVHSVSCGDRARAINHTSMAKELMHALRRVRAGEADGDDDSHDDGDGESGAVQHVYLATNLECDDPQVVAMGALLRPRRVELVCAQDQLRARAGGDNFLASLIEQEICARAEGFVGSKYSTWTDTVKGLRAQASATRHATFTFEELWAEGVW